MSVMDWIYGEAGVRTKDEEAGTMSFLPGTYEYGWLVEY